MIEFNLGDRIVVGKGEWENQHGKIIEEIIIPLSGWNDYKVKLDNGVNDEFSAVNIKHEDLNSDEISKVITNITEKIQQASGLEEMKTELTTHIGYNKAALISSKDKSRADIEYKYVTSNLERLSEKKILSQDWMESIQIDLEKIDWALKRL